MMALGPAELPSTRATEDALEDAGPGRFRRLRESLRRTRQALTGEIQATLFDDARASETWERLEEALIYADVGAAHDRPGRRGSSSARPAQASLSGGEALTRRLTELLAEIARTGDDRIDPAPRSRR